MNGTPVPNVVALRAMGKDGEAERVVTKILEFEIMDIAWLQILRKHPDLQLGADGRPIPLEPNYRIHQRIRRVRGVETDAPVSSITSLNDVYARVDSSGLLQAFDAYNHRLEATTDLFSLNIKRHHGESNGSDDEPYLYSPSTHMRIAASVVFPSLQADKEITNVEEAIPPVKTRCHSRCIVYNIILKELPEQAESTADKKKQPKKGAPPPFTKQLLYRVLVVDLCSTSTGYEDGSHFIWQVVHEMFFNCESHLQLHSNPTLLNKSMLDDTIGFDLSLSGRLLTLLFPELAGGCQVLQLRPPSISDSTEHGRLRWEPATENESAAHPRGLLQADIPQAESIPLSLSTPPILAEIKCSSVALSGAKIRKAVLIRNEHCDKAGEERGNVSTEVQNSAEEKNSDSSISLVDLRELHHASLLVFLHKELRWMIFGFRIKSSIELHPLEESVAGTKVAAPKKGAPTEALPPPLPADLYLLAQWETTSAVTCFAVDPMERKYLALGLQDGTVSLWNTADRNLIDVVGKHACQVTCLSLHCKLRAAIQSMHIVSGALDGTLCFFATASAHESRLYAEHKLKDSPTSLCVQLVGFRADVQDAVVLDIQRYDYGDQTAPIMIVQYSNGALAAYDWEKCILIGRLEKKERLDFEDYVSTFSSFFSLPKFEDPVKRNARLRKEEETAVEAAAAEEELRRERAETGGATGSEETINRRAIEVVTKSPKDSVCDEEEIDNLPFVEVVREVGGELCDSWIGHRSIFVATLDRILCFAMMEEQPKLVEFSYESLLKEVPSEHAVSDDKIGVDSNANMMGLRADSNFTHSGTGGGFDRKKELHTESFQPPNRQLRLTEERLQALEESFLSPIEREQRTHYDNTADRSLQTLPKLSTAVSLQFESRKKQQDPRVLALTEVLKSKHEREARKSRFKKTAQELGSLLL